MTAFGWLLLLLQAVAPTPAPAPAASEEAAQTDDPENPTRPAPLPEPKFGQRPPGAPPVKYDPSSGSVTVKRIPLPVKPAAPAPAAAASPPTMHKSQQSDAAPSPPTLPASTREASLATPPRTPTGFEQMLTRSEDSVPITVLIDELLDELAHQMGKEDARALSPMAIRWVKLSPNLRADMAAGIETRLTARLSKATEIAQVVCTDCRSLRSRVEGRDWVVSLGAVHHSDLQRVADEIGARSFLDLDLEYVPGPPQSMVVLSARAFRASDARILFATAIRADETTAAVLRTGKKPPSREEQLAELERKLEARPYYGIGVLMGMAWIPYDGPGGGITGATIGARAFERFGVDRRHMYGIQAEGFLNPNRLQAGVLSAVYAYDVTPPDLNKPDLRLSWGVGAFIASGASNEGNTILLQSSADYIMKFRFSFGVGLHYLVPTQFNNYDLGGFGVHSRFAFNW
jgi:hypothetical protein